MLYTILLKPIYTLWIFRIINDDELVVLPKPTTSKPKDFPKDNPKVRFSELESEDEFVFKPWQKPNQVLESDSDSDEASDDNERTLVSMSFKEGTMETIDKLTFLSQILIKKNQILLETILKGSKLVEESMVATSPEKIN